MVEFSEFAGEQHYRFACSDEHHHHHIICIRCRKTITFEVCPMTTIFGAPDGFQITGHKFEIYGYCRDCA